MSATNFRCLAVLGVAMLAGCGGAPCVGQPGSDWVAGEVGVRFKDSVSTEQQATEVIQSEGLSVLQFTQTTPPFRAYVATPTGTECTTLERLQKNPSVSYAYLNIILHAE